MKFKWWRYAFRTIAVFWFIWLILALMPSMFHDVGSSLVLGFAGLCLFLGYMSGIESSLYYEEDNRLRNKTLEEVAKLIETEPRVRGTDIRALKRFNSIRSNKGRS